MKEKRLFTSTTRPVTRSGSGPRSSEGPHDITIDALEVGSRISGYLRIEQVVEGGQDAALYLADDERRSELVLLVLATSTDVLANRLAGPAAGAVIERTTWGPWHIAEIELEESHLHHFAGQFLATSGGPLETSAVERPPSETDARLTIGSTFADRYRVDGVLGQGGTGEVYRAYDTTFERYVALKVVRVDPSESAEDREAAKRRLLNEARVVSALKHPHIVEIYDAGQSRGVPYLVLELCDGGSLRNAMADGASRVDGVRWLEEIADALAYAHDQGVIHRDVKPENALLTDRGTVKVADFGIAKALKRDRARENTTMGIVGTPRYMAPEQLFGSKIDARADQFAWGLVAYELLTGSHPRAQDLDTPEKATTSRIPAQLHRVIRRAIESDPKVRYTDFHALLADLRRRPSRRIRYAAFVAAMLFAIAGAAASLLGFDKGKERGPSSRVEAKASPSFDAEKTDAEIGGRCAPAARHHLTAALQLWRDASQWAAASRFDEATKVDPDCASASVYYLLATRRTFPKRREHFRLAREQRAKLGERERQLLEALEPSISDPPDFEDVSRRASALVQRMPQDLDARILYEYALYRLDRLDEALAISDQTAALAPKALPSNELLAALVQIRRRDPGAALERFRNCLTVSPDSADCLLQRGLLLASQGSCSQAQSEFRHLTSVMPRDARAQFDLGNVLLTSTKDPAAARAAFEERQRLYATDAFTFDPTAEVGRLADEYRMAAVSGDLETALEYVRKWNSEAERSNSGKYRGDPLWELIEVLRELGMVDEARALARKGLREHLAWTGDESLDVGIELARLTYLTGGMGANEYRAFRQDWIHRRQRSPMETWLGGFAGLPEVGADMESPLAPGRYAEDWISMGESPENTLRAAAELLRLGRTSDAVLHADAAAKDCLAYSPITYVRAQIASASARDAAGDVAGACRQYGAVRDFLARSPRSTSLRLAIKRLKELSCREILRR